MSYKRNWAVLLTLWGSSFIAVATDASDLVPKCEGDFNYDERVTVNELVTAVNHALTGCPSPRARFVDNGDGTVTDMRTGLVWEKKVMQNNTPDPANLHDADNSYPWTGLCGGGMACRTDAECPGGQACEAQDSPGTGHTIFEWAEALNAQGFAGYTDWRVPTVGELNDLVDYSNLAPSINQVFHDADTGGCPDVTDPACSRTSSNFYWTSTPSAGDSTASWAVSFFDGFVSGGSKQTLFFVRGVRGPVP
jgi:hypothetical protein